MFGQRISGLPTPHPWRGAGGGARPTRNNRRWDEGLRSSSGSNQDRGCPKRQRSGLSARHWRSGCSAVFCNAGCAQGAERVFKGRAHHAPCLARAAFPSLDGPSTCKRAPRWVTRGGPWGSACAYQQVGLPLEGQRGSARCLGWFCSDDVPPCSCQSESCNTSPESQVRLSLTFVGTHLARLVVDPFLAAGTALLWGALVQHTQPNTTKDHRIVPSSIMASAG